MTKHPIHPFLLAPLPYLYMLYVNLDQVSAWAGIRISLLAVLGAALLYIPLRLLTHDARRAGLIASVIITLFFLSSVIGKSAIFMSLAAVIVPWKKVARWIEITVTFALNAVTLGMTIMIVALILWTGVARDLHLKNKHPVGSGMPDIYFIVLDSYASHSLLLDRFGYDDSDFRDKLIALGFQVGECTSPAPLTAPSLTRYLNADPDLEFSQGTVTHPYLRSELESRGYSTWAFSTGWIWTEMVDADRYFQPAYGPMSEFEAFAMRLTPLQALVDVDAARADMMRRRAWVIFDRLADASQDSGSQFVFAHIIQPHPPFVFDQNGTPTDASDFTNPIWAFGDSNNPEFVMEDYERGYIGQVEFIGKVLPPILEQIIENAPGSQIILTADHGPWYPRTDDENFMTFCSSYGLPSIDPMINVKSILGE